jgi:hypothetical protein
MIPNVGNMAFYMQTMINDFTADILFAMSLMAGQLERKTMVAGPIMISPFFSNSNGLVDPIAPAQILTPVSGNGIHSPTLNKAPIDSDPAITSASALQTSLHNSERTKKRTPARIQKLLGDLYLLAGCLDLAIACFVTAMEGAKLNNDYQWQASALEGYICAQLVSLISELKPKLDEGGPIQPLLSSREIIEIATESKKLYSFICEVPERYREVIILYDKAHNYGSFGYYPILQIQASLRIASFLSFAFISGFSGTFINSAGIPWYNEAKSLTAELSLRISSNTGSQQGPNMSTAASTLIPQQSSSQTEKAILQNGMGVTRLDILTWITRISLTGNEYLTPKDYLIILSEICALCSRIDATRKHAFFLRLTGTVTKHLEMQQGPVVIYQNRPPLRAWSLATIHHVYDLLESPRFSTVDEDDFWLERYSHILKSTPGSSMILYSLRYGWPELQIGVLKQSIQLAEADKGIQI